MKIIGISLGFILFFCTCTDDVTLEADLIIYGGTSSAVIAAVEGRASGKSVILVSPDRHLGGLSAGGLGWSDTGNKNTIGVVS